MTGSVELWPGRVRAAYAEVLGDAATVDDGYGPLGVDVPADRWVEAVSLARDGLDCTFFDWLTAVDELDDGFRIVCHVAARPEPRRGHHRTGGVDHVVVRTLVPREPAVIESLGRVFAGARWHERETHEMFGIDFTLDGAVLELETLLLPDEFEGHPLRKEFVLASRVAKPWPGAKEPGESDHGGAPTARRKARAPGVPTPEEWGPRPAELSEPDAAGTAHRADDSEGGTDA